MKQKFKISGMHCSSCSLLIDEELEAQNGVASSDTSLKKEESVVVYDENSITEGEIVSAIAELGYSATPTT